MLFEGGARRSSSSSGRAQLVGGRRGGGEVWDEVRARPRPRVDADDPVLRALHERIRAGFAQA